MFHPLVVPERRGLRDDGAEDGGGAEEDEGAVHGRALPCLEVNGGSTRGASPSCEYPPQAQAKESVGIFIPTGLRQYYARMVSGRLGAQVECMTWGRLCLCTCEVCETPCERSSVMSFICAWLQFGVQRSRFG